MTQSLGTVLIVLTMFGGFSLILYKFLENVQDSARGLSIEQSMARRDRKADAKRTKRLAEASERIAQNPDTPPSPTEKTVPPKVARLRQTNTACSHRETGDWRRGPYQRIVFQCPYATDSSHRAFFPNAHEIDFTSIAESASRKTG